MSEEHETLNPIERWGQLFALAGILLVAGYLYLHQVLGTGFFTEAFGQQEQLALWVPLLLSLGGPIAKLFSGRRTPALFFEAAANIALAFGSYHLVRVFPFDFSHLADPLPAFLRWPIVWIRDPFGRIILWIQVAAGVIGGLSNGAKFLRRIGES